MDDDTVDAILPAGERVHVTGPMLAEKDAVTVRIGVEIFCTPFAIVPAEKTSESIMTKFWQTFETQR